MSDGIRLVGAAATRDALDPTLLLASVDTALRSVADGSASCPARIAARTPFGLLGAMPGYVPGLGLAAKITTVYPTGDEGRSAHRGVVVLFDEETGAARTVMDAEPITAARTAATATVAMRTLARRDRRVVAVIGAGVQARAQVEFLLREPQPLSILVGVRDAGRSRPREWPERVVVTGIENAVRAADVVMCCTGAREPVLRREGLRAGAHVSSIGGSDGPEIDAATVAAGAVFCEWPGAVAERPPAGAHELQGVDPGSVSLLGDVLRGVRPGRQSDEQITVFKSTGHAALDVAAAHTVDDVIQRAVTSRG